ncbi:hypothetical protein GVN15_18495 [Pseudomonas putida]|uniref:heparin lyase I family protein n=1 Tax=Pseudomonas putida TaxID=303 RepID=UPI001377AC8B|nr:heparin lyase I family protein [Pseudomonas putida]NBA82633.1 hypothetical protein [Pseudomonas putida]
MMKKDAHGAPIKDRQNGHTHFVMRVWALLLQWLSPDKTQSAILGKNLPDDDEESCPPNAPENFLMWVGSTTPLDRNQEDEQKATHELFRMVETGGPETGASLKVVRDTERGKVWLFDKPAHTSNYRCESNSIKVNVAPYEVYEGWKENQIYDFCWSSKFPEVDNDPYGDYVIFQWKSEGSNVYPFFMKVQAGRFEMTHYNTRLDGEKHKVVWWTRIEADKWYDIRIRVLLSSDQDIGTVQLFLDNAPQKFTADREGKPREPDERDPFTLVCQTFSPAQHYLKWGVYNTGFPLNALKHYVDKLMVKRIA